MAIKASMYVAIAAALSAFVIVVIAESPAPEESECASELQTRATSAAAADDAYDCQGPWCATLTSFCKLFDSNNPWQMQKAFDQYSEYASNEQGIKLAVTKDHFYEMYHGNVAMKLGEYLPQGLFAWKFGDKFEIGEPSESADATIARTGTITFKLGWYRRRMFWNTVIKELPDGAVFPYSEVEEFDDCTECPAKMLFSLKNGGLDGKANTGWKITGLSLIKLA